MWHNHKHAIKLNESPYQIIVTNSVNPLVAIREAHRWSIHVPHRTGTHLG
jgi:hypothetical protein